MAEHHDPETGCALIGLILLAAGALIYVGSWLTFGWAGVAGLALVTALIVGALGIAVGITARRAP